MFIGTQLVHEISKGTTYKKLRNTKEQQKNKRNLIYLIFKKYLTIVSPSIQRGNRMSNTNQKKKKKKYKIQKIMEHFGASKVVIYVNVNTIHIEQ